MIELLKIILPIIFGLSLFQAGIRYIFSPVYRLTFNKKKYSAKRKGLEELYKTYKDYTSSTDTDKPPAFLMNAKVSSYLGTNRYDYRLLFLLIENNFSNIELLAKRIDDAWPILKIEYLSNDIKLVTIISLKKMNFWRKWIAYLYLLLSATLMLAIFNYKLFGEWAIASVITISFFMYLCIWIGSRFSTVLSINRILPPE